LLYLAPNIPYLNLDFKGDLVTNNIWIALAIGNSRYHWAWFLNTQLQSSWDTTYIGLERVGSQLKLLPLDLQREIDRRQIYISTVPIYLISVVPSQTTIWQKLSRVKQITLADIPLVNLYSTLGIDRAVAIFGAGEIYGYPVLVIDGGTALTITGVDKDRHLVGGAILPGLKLQLNSLSIGTAGLPQVELPTQLPPRWSNNTNDAIASGILHTISAGIVGFIDDWERLYPHSQIILTGGDGELIMGYLKTILPAATIDRVRFDRQLIFHGFAAILG
jgi:type III pantothenate kinase